MSSNQVAIINDSSLDRPVAFTGWDSRATLLVAVSVAATVATFILPRIDQNPAYHQFADGRDWVAIPNFLNVVSNLAFLIVGMAGLVLIAKPRPLKTGRSFLDGRARWPYAIFFLGVALTSIGSSYYHLVPENGRLVWDRLPMTIAFMGFFAAIIAERISLRAGLALLIPLLIAGGASVFYWDYSERMGAGDLRPYILVQFYPLLAIMLMMFLYPPRYTRSLDIAWALGFYGLAKILEVLDVQVFQLGGLVSGHTLKHVVAALAPFWILRMLMRREAVPPAAAWSRLGSIHGKPLHET